MPNSFGIYVHVPFCVHKCSYCDFFSFTKYVDSDFASYVARLEREVAEGHDWMRSRAFDFVPLRSVFFGGGTPSLLPPSLLFRLLDAIERLFLLTPDTEITVEANPETVSRELCESYREDGRINRISLGAQSFAPSSLKNLERLGSADQIRSAAGILREFGYRNFNLDLIFGIPGQGVVGMIRDIEEAARLEPAHLSFYSLTLKSAHPLYNALPGDDESADLYERGVERLSGLGYERYEVSNFSRPGLASRHNLLYWDGGDFLGLGPSAASRFFRNGKFSHRKQTSDFPRYLESPAFPSPGLEDTTESQTILEAAFLELRKCDGVSLAEFSRRYHYDLTGAKQYPLFLRSGLLAREGDCLKLTPRGMLLADRVTRDLVDVG